MNQTQLDGITKARLRCNIERARGTDPQIETDADYIAFVTASAGLSEFPESAADSYAAQHAGVTIAELETELAEALTPEPEPEPQP